MLPPPRRPLIALGPNVPRSEGRSISPGTVGVVGWNIWIFISGWGPGGTFWQDLQGNLVGVSLIDHWRIWGELFAERV